MPRRLRSLRPRAAHPVEVNLGQCPGLGSARKHLLELIELAKALEHVCRLGHPETVGPAEGHSRSHCSPGNAARRLPAKRSICQERSMSLSSSSMSPWSWERWPAVMEASIAEAAAIRWASCSSSSSRSWGSPGNRSP